MVDAIETWYVSLSHVVQLVIWGVALLMAAACCGTKARPVYHGGR